MATFTEKKEADLSGKRNANPRSNNRGTNKGTPTPKGKAKDKDPKDKKVNGHAPSPAEPKAENGIAEETTANGEETTEA
jgi:hypothetical protein